MTGITKTNEKTTTNLSKNETKIYVSRLVSARWFYMDWINKDNIHWSEYQIKETDMRVKTATFTSNTYLDLTTGTYCVLITSTQHEDFGGVILSVEKDEKNGLYKYQCQDFTRQYQDKIDIIGVNLSIHRILKNIITRGGVPLVGDATKAAKNWKNELSGLKPAYQYEQVYWGVDKKKNFNPMSKKVKMIIRNKSRIEAVRDLVFGAGGYIDVYTNKYGVLKIEPYHKKDLFGSRVTIPYETIQDMKVSFDTTNLVTGVQVQSTDKLKVGRTYDPTTLFGLDLRVIFGDNGASISNPASAKVTAVSKKSASTSTKKISGNPYNTKKKKVYLNSDNIRGKSTDRKFLKDIGKLLKKQGWSYKIIGVGPNTHTETYARKYKNGVWFCVYGGADGAVFRECARKNSYTNTLKKNNLRTVIGMRQGCDIRKGGKCYKWLRRAHDDNYSPSSYKGVSYPLNMLTKAKVPIMYASTPEKMVAKFLKGGDNPKAC